LEEKVRILIVEDYPPDAELEKFEIRKTIKDCEFLVVDTKENFLEALEKFDPHVIVSDYSLPTFNGMAALKLTLEKTNLIPFILCTGSMNEDVAVECIKNGATDYIIKEHTKRLGESVKNALEIRETRIHGIEVEEKARLYKTRLQSLFDISQFKTHSIQELLDFALSEVVKISNSKIGYIYHYYEDKKEFVLNTWSKEVMTECTVKKPETINQLDRTGIWGEAVRQRKPILVNDFSQPNPLLKGYPEGHVALIRFLSIPIFIGDTIVAVVGVANKETDYTESDITQLTLMMDSVWKIVKQKESDLALYKTKERYRIILNYSPIGIAAFNEQGFLSGTNDAFKNIFCLPPGVETADMNIFDTEIVPSAEKEKLLNGEVITYEKDFSIPELESIFKCKMNRSGKIDLELTIKTVETNPINQTFEFLLQVQEITERKKVENIKNDFINIVSHEMRTPLTSMRESMMIMKKYYQDNLSVDQKDLLEMFLRNINRLSKLIQDMLDFQKLNSTKMEFNKKPESINVLIEQIIIDVQTLTAGSHLQISVELEPDLPKVFIDRDRISQTLSNLITNAIKFTEKGSITIKTEFDRTTDRIKVSVIDTGIGINQEEIRNIFTPFYQAKKDMEHQTGGTGLGLPISQKILIGHDSELKVISEVGKGSTFFFYLPAIMSRGRGN